jgi:hypothetical protein
MPNTKTPELTLVYEALVDVGERRALGGNTLGQRFIIDILGGSFEGPQMRGRVLPGGADRQLLRADGVKQLHAVYEMQTDDGAVLTIDNRVVIDESVTPQRYARSTVVITAPAGPHDWLNRRVFVGTLHSLRPERDAVSIRVYLVD